MKKIALLLCLLFYGTAFAQYPVSDSLSTAGSLSANWTQTTYSSFYPVAINPAGSFGLATGTTGYGLAYWGANSFTFFGTSNQYSQVTVVSAPAIGATDRTGLCVLVSASGGYCYSFGLRQMYKFGVGGYPTYFGGGNYANAGDVWKLTAANGIIAIYQNGTLISSVADSTYTTGAPGVYVDRASVNGTAQMGSFSADCYPSSCGTIPPPAFSVQAGSYGPAQTVALSTTFAGASICYTLDGSTPTASTPGTCGGGTTQTYSSALTISSTTTVKALVTATSPTTPSQIAANTYTILGVQIIADTPFYPLAVFPGSQRQVEVQINYGTTNKVNWSATSTGGATVTFNGGQTSLTNDLPIASLTFGGTGSVCAFTGSYPVVSGTLNGTGGLATISVSGGSGFPPNVTINGNFYGSGMTDTTPATYTLTTDANGNVTSAAIANSGVGYSSFPSASHQQINYTPFSYSSASTVTVTAQAVDQPSHSDVFHFNVCQASDVIHIDPPYQAAYSGQTAMMYSSVEDANQAVTWSVASQPAGANVVLPDTTNRDVQFPGSTVPGRYTLKACSVNNPAQCANGIVYVGPTALPYASTPAHTRPYDCIDNDPQMSPVYDVGPGHTYSTINSVPSIFSWTPGTKLQIWNTDTTGSNPTSYSEWLQISSSGTNSAPIEVCGVPDAAGNMPIIGGGNALTTQAGNTSAWATNSGGTIVFWPNAANNIYGTYGGGLSAPTNVVVAGLHIQGGRGNGGFAYWSANTLFRYAGTAIYYNGQTYYQISSFTSGSTFSTTDSSGNTVLRAWQLSDGTTLIAPAGCPSASAGSFCQNIVAGEYVPVQSAATVGAIGVESGAILDLTGNWSDGNQTCVFSADNGSHGYADMTQDIYIEGNACTGFGTVGVGQVHGMYLQTLRMIVTGNYFASPVAGATGSGVKLRGEEEIVNYNYFNLTGSTLTRMIDLVENQDIPQYVTFESYLGAFNYRQNSGATASGQGSFSFACSNAWNCPSSNGGNADAMSANQLALNEEAHQHTFIYGNILHAPPAQVWAIHYGEDHDGQMASRNGLLSLYNNTIDGCQALADTGSNGLGYHFYLVSKVYAANNICWYSGYQVVDRYETLVGQWQRNLFPSGRVSLATPLTSSSIPSPVGWEYNSDGGTPQPLAQPIDGHQINSSGAYGFQAADWIFSSTQPYNSTTFVPQSGSAAINAGSAIQGPAALLPVRYQYSPANYSLTSRQNALTIGGADSGPPPTLQSVVLSPLATTLQTGQTQQYLATCNYSDASATNCTATVTWSSSQPGIASITTNGLASGIASGQTTIMAVSSAISGSTTLTVFVLPTSQWQGMSFKGVTIH